MTSALMTSNIGQPLSYFHAIGSPKRNTISMLTLGMTTGLFDSSKGFIKIID